VFTHVAVCRTTLSVCSCPSTRACACAAASNVSPGITTCCCCCCPPSPVTPTTIACRISCCCSYILVECRSFCRRPWSDETNLMKARLRMQSNNDDGFSRRSEPARRNMKIQEVRSVSLSSIARPPSAERVQELEKSRKAKERMRSIYMYKKNEGNQKGMSKRE
jgi:hypothetical protein